MKIEGKEHLGRLFTVFVFLVISVAGIAFSIYLFSIANDVYTYLIAVLFFLLSLTSSFFNLLTSYWYYKSAYFPKYLEDLRKKLKPVRTYPTVAVVMPTHDEEVEMIGRNITELAKMDYPKDKLRVYLLNDSNDHRMKTQLQAICEKRGVTFIYRDTNAGFKAGALNNFLKYSDEEFVAIFDADEFLTNKKFVRDLVPYFQDPQIAYVQTEKKYAKGTFFSDSVDISDSFFYKFIESARSMGNTATFAGSCGMIRRSALDKIGGIPEYAVEDTFFSFESGMNNYRGLYIPNVYALGSPINTFSKLVKQQWRYSYGHTEFIEYMLKRKGTGRKALSKKVDYLAHGLGLNYLSLVLIAFTAISIAIIFSYLPVFNMSLLKFLFTNRLSLDIEIFCGLAFFLSMIAPMVLSKVYYDSFSKGFMVFLLNYALAFVRTKATLTALFSFPKQKDHSWTWKHNKESSSIGLGMAFKKARTEVTFASGLMALSVLALAQYNLIGGLWLGWYSIMYFLSPLFFYVYG